MKIRPVKEVIVNDVIINNKTKWNDIVNIQPSYGCLWKAYDLFFNSAYPAYFKLEMEKCDDIKKLSIFSSEHNKFKNDIRNHPEWFKI